MKIVVHVCLADAEPLAPASVRLPGGLVAQFWTPVEPEAPHAGLRVGVGPIKYRVGPLELAQPGLTFECYSMEEAAYVLRRELDGAAYVM
jgi:hypothetical protein